MKTKPLCSYMVCLIAMFLIQTGVHADTDLDNLSASVGVNAVFDLGVWPTSLNFSSVNPGATTEILELTVFCSTNNNSMWNVQLSDVSELTAGVSTIPNANFNWWGWASGSGAWYAGDSNMNTTPFNIYDSGVNEGITSAPVELHLSFNIDIPSAQAAGDYTTTLVITMTE